MDRTLAAALAVVVLSALAPGFGAAFGQNVDSSGQPVGESGTLDAQPHGPAVNTSLNATSASNPKIGARLEARLAADSAGTKAADTGGVELVQVVLEADHGQGPAVARQVENRGGRVQVRAGDFVQATVPRTAVRELAKSRAVSRVREPIRPETTGGQGATVSEGLDNMNVTQVHERGITGRNATVVVIDGGFNLSNPEIEGHVVDFHKPGGTFTNTSDAHGTAVTELVVDTAPNASIVTIDVDTLTEWRKAVDYINQDTSADVVVSSLSWYGLPLDGDSVMDHDVNRTVANGTVWLTSAGNTGYRDHWNGTWQDGDADGYHNFTNADETLYLGTPATVEIWLTWTDWEQWTEDYDLLLVDRSGTVVDASTNAQDGSYPPREIIANSSLSGSRHLYLLLANADANGTSTFNAFFQGRSDPEYWTSQMSVTVPATGPNAIAVGATAESDNTLEAYSARGPTVDGRRKPELVAPTGVSTSVYDPFYGTSASAPHAAGVAALVVGANESLSPEAVTRVLTNNTRTVQESEPNNRTGYGLLDAKAAVSAVTDLDTTAPVVSNATAVDLTDGDGEVSGGDAVELSVTATDANSGVRSVTANASALGTGNVTLTDGNNDTVYNATVTVNASAAAPDGSYAVPIVATDHAGNANATRTNPLQLNTSDRTPPSLRNATAIDLTDGDGTVGGGDTVGLAVTATDSDSGVRNVTANASAFGTDNVTLTDGNNDTVYNATLTVNASAAAPNGTYAIPVVATDAAGNSNATRTNVLNLNVSDRSRPAITSFSVAVVDTRKLSISFESNESLADVEIRVANATDGSTVRTLTESDVRASNGSYVDTIVLDRPGRYNVSLATAADSAGNDGASGQQAAVTLVTRRVRVKHVGGPRPADMSNITATVYLTQGERGILRVQLRDRTQSGFENRTDLSNLGVEPNTTLAVNVTVRDWTPRLLAGAGRNATWTVTSTGPNTTAMNVTTNPANVQYNSSKLRNPGRPWSESNRADIGANATVDMTVTELSALPAPLRDPFSGVMLLTDAQEIGAPRYNSTTDTLSVRVGAPHLNTHGNQNRGFFTVFVPNRVLERWGVSEPQNVAVSSMGQPVEPVSSFVTADGMRLTVPVHYSAGVVEISPADVTPPAIPSASITDATDGDGNVSDGDEVSVSATVTDTGSGVESVTADAVAFGAGTVSLTDTDGDGTYTATFTVDGSAAGSEGAHSLTVTATDVAGNTNATTTNALTFVAEESTSGGGGGSSGGGSSGGSTGGSTGGGGGSAGGSTGGISGGGTGGSSGTTSTADRSQETNDTSAPTTAVVETTGGAKLIVRNASANESVTVEFGNSTASTLAKVVRISVTPRTATSEFQVSVSAPTATLTAAPSLPSGTAEAYFRVNVTGISDGQVRNATLQVSISSDALPTGTEPREVVLYRYHDGQWRRLSTEHLGRGVYEAEVSGFSVFAIAHPTEEQATTATPIPTPTPTPARPTPTSTVTSTRMTTRTGPGFELVTAVLALLATAVLVRQHT